MLKEIFDLVSSIVESLAWPISSIVLVLILRTPISEVLSRLGKLKYGDLEAEFTEGMKDIAESLGEVLPNRGSRFGGSAEVSVIYNRGLADEVREIALVSPEASVPHAWSRIETTVKEKYRELNSPDKQSTSVAFSKAITFLLQHEMINTSTFDVIDKMRILRNSVAHSSPRNELTLNAAIEYGRNAELIIDKVKSIQLESTS